MSLGQGNITIGNKRDSSGGGGTLVDANNGLSVDTGTGTIAQLGSDPGNPAGALLSPREIAGAFSINMPDGKLGIGTDNSTITNSDQSLMVLSDEWTNGLRAAAFFARSLVTPSVQDVLIDSIIPGSFSAHLVNANGSFTGGAGSVIAAVKGNLVSQNNNPAMKTSLQVNSIVAGLLALGAQNLTRVALFRAQSPDTSGSPSGTIDEIVGFLIEAMDSINGSGGLGPNTYGILQEGPNDQNVMYGRTGIGAENTNGYKFEVVGPTSLQTALFRGDQALIKIWNDSIANIVNGAEIYQDNNGAIVINPNGNTFGIVFAATGRAVMGATTALSNAKLEMKTVTNGDVGLNILSQDTTRALQLSQDNAGNGIINTASGVALLLRVNGNTIGYLYSGGYVQNVGNVQIDTVGAGVTQRSPDGTLWRLTVSNAGVVGAVLA